jgi:hypothetical protein
MASEPNLHSYGNGGHPLRLGVYPQGRRRDDGTEVMYEQCYPHSQDRTDQNVAGEVNAEVDST